MTIDTKTAPFLNSRSWEMPLTALDKGVPAIDAELRIEQSGALGWNILAEDLPLPAAVLKRDAIRHNSAWMRRFLLQHGVDIAPHGKTTMAPALFDTQIADGAWAITVSTAQHFQVACKAGFRRIFMANQLVGRRAIVDVVARLKAEPEIEFYCLVDDPAHARTLAAAVRDVGMGRRLNVLVELGYVGGRTGCRTVEGALALAREVHAAGDALCLCGIEGFEGLIRSDATPEALAQVNALLDGMVELAEAASGEGLFGAGEVLLSAGGSSYFDIVAERLKTARLGAPKRILLRSGCYITHDSVLYVRAMRAMQRRNPGVAEEGGGLLPALEIWAYVQSRPEAGKAIVAFGKRDCSYDDPPVPLKWFRPGADMAVPQEMPAGHTVLRLNDQHCHLEVPETSPLRVGDMVAFGISHPCLTFDKWRVLHVVDEDYGIVGSMRTYF